MVSTITKTGRPSAVYRTSWGDQIPGLRRLKDGRWRTSWPKQTTFTESDERLAVARFRQWEAGQGGRTISIPKASAPIDDAEAVKNAREFAHPASTTPIKDPRTPFEKQVDDLFGPQVVSGPDEKPTYVRPSADGTRLEWHRGETNAASFWAWLRELIITQPKYIAEMTGIEQIGYLAELPKPMPSPTMEALITTYESKPGVSAEEVSRVRRFWDEFVGIVGVKTIRELTHELVEQYEKRIQGMNLSSKSIKHRYSRVRTVVAHGLKRGKGIDDCRRAMDRLAMLEAKDANTLDPRPIRSTDFWAIHAEAVKAEDHVFAGLMIFALNCALYSSEVGAVKWDEIDTKRGEFTTRRRKTKVPRVAVLWKETSAALKAIPRNRETVFNTSIQAYNRMSVHRDWTTYRKAAKVPDGVTFSMIRDAAFTIGCRTDLDQARVLAGHRLPGAVDNYVARNPQFVVDACQAIHKEFFGAKQAKGKRKASI